MSGPIPCRHVETGNLYRSLAEAVQAITGCPIHGRHRWRREVGRPILEDATIEDLEPDDPDWVRLFPPKQRRLGGRRPRRVMAIETGTVYESYRAAAAAVFVIPQGITRACRSGGRAAGLHWRYLEPVGSDGAPDP